MTRTIEEVATEFGVAHTRFSQDETRKKKLRQEFLDLVEAHYASQTLARKIVPLPGANEEYARIHIAQKFPTWRVVKLDQQHDRVIVTLEEDPSLKSYKYVNPTDGKVYEKNVQEGSALLDDERLASQDPELWNEITVEVTQRVPKSLDELTEKQQAKLREYFYYGEPKVVMMAPRKAKPEDLADG